MRAVAVLSVVLALALLMAASKAKSAVVRDYVTRGLLCIHHYEGAWNANTGNGYYGGLQMDYGFMRTYGYKYLRRYGTADNWKPRIQLIVGRRGYKARGWNPWPNTSRSCGLY